MADKKISELVLQDTFADTDLGEKETAGGASRKFTGAALAAKIAALIAAHVADVTSAHTAEGIDVVDTGGNFTATNVETILAEIAGVLSGGLELVDFPVAGGAPDSDDGIIGVEDGVSSQFSISQIRDGLLAVDGAGSGLDADKLDGIEGAAYVQEVDYDANTILAADTNDTPTARTISTQQVVGRITAGNIKGLTVAELITLLNTGTTLNADTLDSLTSADFAQLAAANTFIGAANTIHTFKTSTAADGSIALILANGISVGPGLYLYASNADSQASLQLLDNRIEFGPGGSTVVDWSASRTGADVLTVASGDDIRMTTAGTNSASVVTVGGTQTLTSKTFTSPTTNTPTITAPTITGVGTADVWKFNLETVSVSSNAGTCATTHHMSKFTNSSAATMTITMSTSSAVDGQKKIVIIRDFSAAAQTIAWVNTENSTVSAPTTSNGSTTLPLTVGFIYNSSTSKWRTVASA